LHLVEELQCKLDLQWYRSLNQDCVQQA
jgi:hypothetical protein